MITSPLELNKLPEEAQQELISYLVEGNSKQELAELYLEALIHEKLYQLIEEVKAHDAWDTEDLYPAIAKLEVQP